MTTTKEMTKAEELARQYFGVGDTGNLAVAKVVSDLTDLLHQYGRLVQEAAAKRAAEYEDPYGLSKEIQLHLRSMDLP